MRKLRSISKFMTPQAGQHIIIMLILPNFKRSKGNEAMKFDPLIEYNVRNIFPQKSCKK